MVKQLVSFGTIAAFSVLAGCSAVTTTELTDDTAGKDTPAGLTYFMPRKDITVEIEITETGDDDKKVLEVSDVTIGTTAAYADRSKVYVLNHGTNWLADNKLTVKVNSAGLLETATAKSTSQVEEAFVNLAKSTAAFDVAAVGGDRSLTCVRPGKYTFIMDINDPNGETMCGVDVNVAPAKQADNGNNLPSEFKGEKDAALSGLFYRQELTYVVTAEHTDDTGKTVFHKAVVVTSPSESKTRFLPISKSFFADSTATFTLVDGVPTDYDQDDKSELVGAFIIPAKVIGAYFEAAGQFFAAFSQNSKNEIALIESEKNLELAEHNAKRDLEAAVLAADRKAELDSTKATLSFEITKKKLDLCIAAVENDNADLIKELKCSELK